MSPGPSLGPVSAKLMYNWLDHFLNFVIQFFLWGGGDSPFLDILYTYEFEVYFQQVENQCDFFFLQQEASDVRRMLYRDARALYCQLSQIVAFTFRCFGNSE